MKRATRLKLQVDALGRYGVVERDILDSDARQCAEIRDLKARLEAVVEERDAALALSEPVDASLRERDRALALRVAEAVVREVDRRLDLSECFSLGDFDLTVIVDSCLEEK